MELGLSQANFSPAKLETQECFVQLNTRPVPELQWDFLFCCRCLPKALSPVGCDPPHTLLCSALLCSHRSQASSPFPEGFPEPL